MTTPFAKTMRSLEREGSGLSSAGILALLALLGAWSAWLFLARVSLYAVTDRARLEAVHEAHALEAPVDGQVVSTRLELGREVARGEVLVELDAAGIRHQIAESEAEQKGLGEQIEKLSREIRSQARALEEARQAAGSALEEARAQAAESVARADLAEREAEVADRLHAQGLIPEADERRARAAAEEHRAAAEARRRSLERLSLDRRGDQSEKEALLAGLDRQMASLRARQEVLQATRARLRFELEQHLIRAPVAGVLGEVVPLQPGAVVEKGARLGAVVPAGSTRIVAEFTPPEALGRVAPGQRGRLRLRGFPWVQYGTVRATVERVASESGRGDVRVELLVDRAASFPVPLHHGFPGDLEIEVESVSPANLVLRAAGRLLTLRAGGGRSVRTGS